MKVSFVFGILEVIVLVEKAIQTRGETIMSNSHSFTEYVSNEFNDKFWKAAEDYLQNHWNPDRYELRRLKRPGKPEIDNINVEYVWVFDKPNMQIQFDTAVSLHIVIPDDDHHYDDYEEKIVWLMMRCKGDLDKNLEDMNIFEVSPYNGKNRTKNPLDDALVPIIDKNQLDKIAEGFLQRHYKKALIEPTWIDPIKLAENMGLIVRKQRITEDGTVFGRSYFLECKSKVYDKEMDEWVEETIPEKTVFVDPQVAFMRNLGAYNNTIVHECVHWDLHKKAFALARLYDENLSTINCQVAGGIPEHAKDAVGWMEWQANALTPRIQMPEAMFKKRADQLFTEFRRKTGQFDMIDLIEPVIDTLATEFGVSRLAAKIRMIDIGYDEAMGAFIYTDGHYVRPHRTGQRNILKPNQTFTISYEDVLPQTFAHREISRMAEKGGYQFVENHLVLNSPVFIAQDSYGHTVLTHYARNHMEECCVVFDIEIKSSYGEYYRSECFLNRDETTPITFQIDFNGGYENANKTRQMKKLEAVWEEETKFCASLNEDFRESLKMGMKWREEMSYKDIIERARLDKDEIAAMHEKLTYKEIAKKKKLRTESVIKITYKEIAERSGLNEETVSRCINGESVSLHTLILICLALHLPYMASMKIIKSSGFNLLILDKNQKWYHYVLMYMYGYLVSDCKKFLEERGVDPL